MSRKLNDARKNTHTRIHTHTHTEKKSRDDVLIKQARYTDNATTSEIETDATGVSFRK